MTWCMHVAVLCGIECCVCCCVGLGGDVLVIDVFVNMLVVWRGTMHCDVWNGCAWLCIVA